MSEYKIKHYDESYIEKQVEIGNYFAQKGSFIVNPLLNK